ncbi:MAG: hypothetical protein CVU05_08710 [Bacteroidetes bacterium HGW-Bacteroidetes-21]|nr:MAG: hypothetical protein CVU05_08710 [Bacteroidetes bacterium HGW-Bacteroidetes-21]
MIQRIQSIFILLSIIATALMFNIPFASIYHPDAGIFILKATGLYQFVQEQEILQSAIYPLLIIISITLFFQVVSLFLYKKRILQIRFCTFSILFHLGILIMAIYYVYQATSNNNATTQYGFSLILPVIAVIMNYLASRYIMKDEKLIKSLNRLR